MPMDKGIGEKIKEIICGNCIGGGNLCGSGRGISCGVRDKSPQQIMDLCYDEAVKGLPEKRNIIAESPHQYDYDLSKIILEWNDCIDQMKDELAKLFENEEAK